MELFNTDDMLCAPHSRLASAVSGCQVTCVTSDLIHLRCLSLLEFSKHYLRHFMPQKVGFIFEKKVILYEGKSIISIGQSAVSSIVIAVQCKKSVKCSSIFNCDSGYFGSLCLGVLSVYQILFHTVMQFIYANPLPSSPPLRLLWASFLDFKMLSLLENPGFLLSIPHRNARLLVAKRWRNYTLRESGCQQSTLAANTSD